MMNLFERIEHARNYLLKNKEFLLRIQKIYDNNNSNIKPEVKTLYYHKSLDYSRSKFNSTVEEFRKISDMTMVQIKENQVASIEYKSFPYTNIILNTQEDGIKVSSRCTDELNSSNNNNVSYRMLSSSDFILYGPSKYGRDIYLTSLIEMLELNLPKDITTWTTEDLVLLRMALED